MNNERKIINMVLEAGMRNKQQEMNHSREVMTRVEKMLKMLKNALITFTKEIDCNLCGLVLNSLNPGY